jgi:uncharacterized protein
MIITKLQACRFILTYQGLYPPNKIKTKKELLAFIKKVGCIQYDPLNIVGRNPDLVLQSRIENYKPDMLQQLLYKDRKLLDGWDKMMSIYSIEDWPYFERRRKAAKKHVEFRKHSKEILNASDIVKDYINKNGPVSSIDLKMNDKVDWHWGKTNLAKAVLENMYHSGELVVHHRINTRRYYDLIEKCIPKGLIESQNFSDEEYQEWYALRRIGSVGLLWNRSGELWHDILKSKERNETLSRLLNKNLIKKIQVNGIKYPFYILEKDIELLHECIESESHYNNCSIIAPLDNVMWDRNMLEALFDFRYRWEAYKPIKEREYGYYVLPVLEGDKFIARFEPGINKKRDIFEIKNWWWESNVKPDTDTKKSIDKCLEQFMKYLNCRSLTL